MSRFNTYMNSHFSGCRLLAEGLDQVRNREVRVYMLPGHFDDVGASDGTDAWIIPLAAEGYGAFATILKGISLKKLLDGIRAGEDVRVVRMIPDNHVSAVPPSGGRRRLVDTSAPAPIVTRRRVITITDDATAFQPVPTAVSRRRHVSI